jgi:hypothetical protein
MGAHMVIIRSYRQALRIARSAGEDAANRRMRKAGRRCWTAADYDCAVNVMNHVLGQLGYGLAAEVRLAA